MINYGIVGLCAGLLLIAFGCSMQVDASSEDLGESQMALGGSGSTEYTVEFSGARDVQISSTSPTTNFGLTTSCGVAGGEVQKSCLIKWDLSSFPTNAVIDAAYVRLDVFDASPGSFDIHQVNASWTELDANWTKRDAVNDWSSPGCNSVPSDRTSAPVASFVGTSGLRFIALNGLGVAMIQNWLAHPSANKGVVIRNRTGELNALSVRSGQYADTTRRPVIGFSYHLL